MSTDTHTTRACMIMIATKRHASRRRVARGRMGHPCPQHHRRQIGPSTRCHFQNVFPSFTSSLIFSSFLPFPHCPSRTMGWRLLLAAAAAAAAASCMAALLLSKSHDSRAPGLLGELLQPFLSSAILPSHPTPIHIRILPHLPVFLPHSFPSPLLCSVASLPLSFFFLLSSRSFIRCWPAVQLAVSSSSPPTPMHVPF